MPDILIVAVAAAWFAVAATWLLYRLDRWLSRPHQIYKRRCKK